MAGVTDTQSIRFGQVTDVITHTMIANEADDIAVQLDAADAARIVAEKRPIAWTRRAAVLGIPVAAATAVPFDTEVWDTHAMIDIAGQPNRITIGATAGTGVYLVQVEAVGTYTGWTIGALILLRNGAVHIEKTFPTIQSGDTMSLSMIINATATTDFYTVSIYHEGGGTTNMSRVDMRAFKLTNP